MLRDARNAEHLLFSGITGIIACQGKHRAGLKPLFYGLQINPLPFHFPGWRRVGQNVTAGIEQVYFNAGIDHHQHVKYFLEALAADLMVLHEVFLGNDLPGQIPVEFLNSLLLIHVRGNLGQDDNGYPQQTKQSQQSDGEL